MQITAAVIGAALILLVLWESFETLVLPRRVTRRLRMTRLYYRASWGFWRRIGRQHPGQRRENYLSVFAPLSLLLLLAIWVGGVVLGFALIQFGLDTPLRPGGDAAFATRSVSERDDVRDAGARATWRALRRRAGRSRPSRRRRGSRSWR